MDQIPLKTPSENPIDPRIQILALFSEKKPDLGCRTGGDLEDGCSHKGPRAGDGFVIRSADLWQTKGVFTVENALSQKS